MLINFSTETEKQQQRAYSATTVTGVGFEINFVANWYFGVSGLKFY